MKQQLVELFEKAVGVLQESNKLPEEISFKVKIDNSKQKQHGDFACNLALSLAKQAKTNPRDLAVLLLESLPDNSIIAKTDIAGPGFINIFVTDNSQNQVINEILQQKNSFGCSKSSNKKRINIEFVSANPTGPLHVGHGRGAALGSALAELLKMRGHDVHTEYYVNDAGRQMDILAASVWFRYLQISQADLVFPSNAYKGEYVKLIANELQASYADKFSYPIAEILNNVGKDEADGGDKDLYIDAIINKAKTLLGADYEKVHAAGLNYVLAGIKQDLADFSVVYDEWFSEKLLADTDAVSLTLDALDKKGLLYKENGATWFKSTEFGDDKDRVVVRDNGQTTYFASDAAYMLNKLNRGYDEILYLLGSDHHGYIPRLKALMQAFGYDKERLKAPLIQFVTLYRGTEKVQMSTRSGSFVTLRELYDEVSVDATRFFYLMRKPEQHVDFDLELAKSKTNENPVYYVQYAHARICSVLRQLKDKNLTFSAEDGLQNLDLLGSEHEKGLFKKLAAYPEQLKQAANRYDPHLLVYYLRELSALFHAYYNSRQFLVEDADERNACLTMCIAVRQIISNGLGLLGISAPEKM